MKDERPGETGYLYFPPSACLVKPIIWNLDISTTSPLQNREHISLRNSVGPFPGDIFPPIFVKTDHIYAIFEKISLLNIPTIALIPVEI